MCEFGVFDDDGAAAPAAVFADLADAVIWGLRRFGPDRFSIRHWPATPVGGAASPPPGGGPS